MWPKAPGSPEGGAFLEAQAEDGGLASVKRARPARPSACPLDVAEWDARA
jgi:hypothetical protein